jgi:hypothetical protein
MTVDCVTMFNDALPKTVILSVTNNEPLTILFPIVVCEPLTIKLPVIL